MVVIFSAYRKRVVMTGKNNPSWEGVKIMNGKEIENKYDITLFRKAVNYDKVATQYYQPHLIIHVGLNKAVQSFVLHEMANKQGEHTLDNDEPVSTLLNVDRICEKFNKDHTLRAESSSDAEKYLAEYIYHTSLCKGLRNRGSTLFVHVPPLDVYTSEQLANGLERILELCLKQLSDDDYYSYDVDIDYKI